MQIKARDSSEVSVGTRTTTAGTSAGNANHFDCFKGSSVKKDAQIELKKESVRTNIAASLEAVAKAPTLASFNGLKQFETLNSFTKLQTKDWSKQSYVSEIPK
jgi:hypothetical protein